MCPSPSSLVAVKIKILTAANIPTFSGLFPVTDLENCAILAGGLFFWGGLMQLSW
jgi:hypothetical protein